MSYHLRCSQIQGPAKTHQSLPERIPNCDPSIYIRHKALLSSGSDHVNAVYFHPLSICLFSRLFLWSFSPLITPLVSLCGLSNRPSVKTCQCRCAKFLLFSLYVDRRECFTAAISLPLLSSLYLYLSCSRLCFGDTMLDSLCSRKMLTWRRAPGCTVCCKPQWNASCRTVECVSVFMSPL